MSIHLFRKAAAFSGLGLLLALPAHLPAQTAAPSDTLESGFVTPPNSAMPRVWWHWLNGNVTAPGITADLEWMHRVNIGGFQMFDGSLGVPVFVDNPVVWMTPEWKADWKHAAAEADRLHLEMAMAASGGWSETAGPWVKPAQGMKKYVWSEQPVSGPAPFHAVLPAPPKAVGKYQDMLTPPPLNFPGPKDMPGAKPTPPQPTMAPTPEFYRDVAVVAYRVPEGAPAASTMQPQVTSSGGAIDGSLLSDHDYNRLATLHISSGQENGWVQLAYPQPYTAQALTICTGISGGFSGESLPKGSLQSSDDGQTWKDVIELPGPSVSLLARMTIRTWSFAPVTAKYFRVLVDPQKLNPIAASLGAAENRDVHFAELSLSPDPTINLWQDKAAFGTYVADPDKSLPSTSHAGAIDPATVVDLTSKMQPDGTLDWQVPAGKWVILRFGYSLTGEVNHPATPAATGLEVDKLSHADVESYVQQYVAMISSTAGQYFGKSFRYFLMDSWEAGNENWTEDMRADFKQRRGYDLIQFLPALTGRVVGSERQSDDFLWDFRRTIADLLAENHYATATDYFKSKGVGLYAEAMGTSLPTTGDGLLNKGQVTIPMGEFWTPLPGQRPSPEHPADVREASSASHIYGKPLVATESFTTTIGVPGWAQSPFYLKPLADENFARGVNRIVVHTSDEQPFVDNKHKPGITLGPFGQDYTRNITWAEQAVAWNTYLARCSYLLQQGKPAGDVAIFYGDGAPVAVPFWKKLNPAPPTHYTYDYINADVLQHHAKGSDGELELDSGMRYHLLVIPDDTTEISLPVLRTLETLVRNGAVLLGPRPKMGAGLDGGHIEDREIATIADQMWGSDAAAPAGHAFGKGRVYASGSIEDVLATEHEQPDVTWSEARNVVPNTAYAIPKGWSDNDLVFTHRTLPEGELYFLASQKNEAFDIDVTFRAQSPQVELWHPDTGKRDAAEGHSAGERMTVPLHFDPDGSVFVFFRNQPGGKPLPPQPSSSTQQLAEVNGPWQVRFAPDLGAPSSITMPTLASWTDNTNSGVKYFSGTATYQRELDCPQSWFARNNRILLDLGTVKEIAELVVNGKPVDRILWKPPYRADLTGLLHPGKNTLEIKVTNLWPNRMIGDQQPGVTKTYTFTDFHAYKASSPLMPSGLLGPVRVLTQAAATQQAGDEASTR